MNLASRADRGSGHRVVASGLDLLQGHLAVQQTRPRSGRSGPASLRKEVDDPVGAGSRPRATAGPPGRSGRRSPRRTRGSGPRTPRSVASCPPPREAPCRAGRVHRRVATLVGRDVGLGHDLLDIVERPARARTSSARRRRRSGWPALGSGIGHHGCRAASPAQSADHLKPPGHGPQGAVELAGDLLVAVPLHPEDGDPPGSSLPRLSSRRWYSSASMAANSGVGSSEGIWSQSVAQRPGPGSP